MRWCAGSQRSWDLARASDLLNTERRCLLHKPCSEWQIDDQSGTEKALRKVRQAPCRVIKRKAVLGAGRRDRSRHKRLFAQRQIGQRERLIDGRRDFVIAVWISRCSMLLILIVVRRMGMWMGMWMRVLCAVKMCGLRAVLRCFVRFRVIVKTACVVIVIAPVRDDMQTGQGNRRKQIQPQQQPAAQKGSLRSGSLLGVMLWRAHHRKRQ